MVKVKVAKAFIWLNSLMTKLYAPTKHLLIRQGQGLIDHNYNRAVSLTCFQVGDYSYHITMLRATQKSPPLNHITHFILQYDVIKTIIQLPPS